MWTPHAVYHALGETVAARTLSYRKLFAGHLDDHILTQIRDASNKGLALGNDRFKEEIESLSGRRVIALKRGPKPKNEKL
ncbi:hypothetical protein [uncultured Amphritea sp.]|uniref:hypothetical protein n=1 Tax=uncultured Amphritea sp. TaxID=981605 RepID=UPI002635470E|nr:hypothetical protein [uncultured Amphritea sp.]